LIETAAAADAPAPLLSQQQQQQQLVCELGCAANIVKALTIHVYTTSNCVL